MSDQDPRSYPCSEPGCPIRLEVEGAYCGHHQLHSAADGDCGPGCPPPYGSALPRREDTDS